MADFPFSALVFIFRRVNFVLDIAVSISRMKRLAASVTGADSIVEVPPDPKPLPLVAQRALAEAEARRNDRASFIDKYVGASCK
jgi:hypothetical protein